MCLTYLLGMLDASQHGGAVGAVGAQGAAGAAHFSGAEAGLAGLVHSNDE